MAGYLILLSAPLAAHMVRAPLTLTLSLSLTLTLTLNLTFTLTLTRARPARSLRKWRGSRRTPRAG